jgi:protein tyrosine/serine phosphatase
MKPWRHYLSLYIKDHGFLRALYSNLFKLPGPMYRSNQPSPARIRRLVPRLKIKTVVNLRGGDASNLVWQLERRVCKALGIQMIDVRILSRSLPDRETIIDVKNKIAYLELPALVHCKSGADRAGLFSVLYRHYRLGEPIELAVNELGLKYGHVRNSRTGILDEFFYMYLRERSDREVTLLDWMSLPSYDRANRERLFHGRETLAARLTNQIDKFLKRE